MREAELQHAAELQPPLPGPSPLLLLAFFFVGELLQLKQTDSESPALSLAHLNTSMQCLL